MINIFKNCKLYLYLKNNIDKTHRSEKDTNYTKTNRKLNSNINFVLSTKILTFFFLLKYIETNKISHIILSLSFSINKIKFA